MRLLLSLAAAALVVSGCGYYNDSGPASTAVDGSRPTFGAAKVLIDTDKGSVLFDAEVAETDRERELGLMHRTSLPEDQGMVFMYFASHRSGFWMKDTLIPLSVAFFNLDGKIIRILDMEPCPKNPCPVYRPGVSYYGAIEVNQGAYERWGVKPGDTVEILR
jgi:uncharacterized membrane protein (UPF0127 family)